MNENARQNYDLQPMEVNSERMLNDLHKFRRFGKLGAGVARPAFSDADVEARKWLAARMATAGLTPKFDAAGNLFGLPPGAGTFLLMGSHSDSQPEGGWLDGSYGVIAALEVARAAIEAGRPAPAVVSFQDEEGRFGHLTGSRVWAGQITLAEADAFVDQQGVGFADARSVFAEVVSDDPPKPENFSYFIEAHIEQGAVLDLDGQAVAAVTDIVGMQSVTVVIAGASNHAGTTPMRLRRDVVSCFAEIASRLEQLLPDPENPESVWTIGRLDLEPNAPSIIPGRIVFDVQWRDPSEDRLETIKTTVLNEIISVCKRRKLDVKADLSPRVRPTHMDKTLVSMIADGCQEIAPGRWRKMVSGALHDAANVSVRMPTAMVFVPSIGGISHNIAENTDEADLVAGLHVLSNTAARLLRAG